MEEPGNKMEEIYALPPRLKYTESWLQMKGKKGFSEYWTVLKGTYMFFFKDQNTHAKEQYVGFIGIEVQQTNCYSKKGSKTDFTIELGKKKFHLRAEHDILRDRWVHAVNLVIRTDAPGPLPGDPDFKEVVDTTPTPNKMKPPGSTRCIVRVPTSIQPISPSGNDDPPCSSPEEIPDEEERESVYDSAFVFPSWYYQNMSRHEAEDIMFEQSPGSYLLRDSDKSKSLYALTIKDIGTLKHHRMWVNETNGQCYFESSPAIKLPNLVKAVDSLMKNRYEYLAAQPICIDNRRSGDGEESSHHVAELPRKVIRSTPEAGYMSPGSVSPQSPSDPFSYPPSPDKQASAPVFQKPKAHSLPGYPMAQQRMPRLPPYENHSIIEHHSRSFDGEQPQENGASDDESDTPPPLPVKKKSLKGTDLRDHTYENVPFVYLNSELVRKVATMVGHALKQSVESLAKNMLEGMIHGKRAEADEERCDQHY